VGRPAGRARPLPVGGGAAGALRTDRCALADGDRAPAKQLGADAVGTAGWVGATALLTAAADRLRVPPAVTAVLLGAAVYAGELKGRALIERVLAERAAADPAHAQLDETPQPEPTP
jgi:hypothetical protein